MSETLEEKQLKRLRRPEGKAELKKYHAERRRLLALQAERWSRERCGASSDS